MSKRPDQSFQIDAVKWMREKRNELSRQFNEHPESEDEELEEIHEKYDFKVSTQRQ